MNPLLSLRPVLVFTLLLPLSVAAQGWMDLGVKANYGLAGFYNHNITSDARHGYGIQSAVAFGGVLGLNFGMANVINVEAQFLNNRQTMDFRENGVENTNEIEWNNLDLYLMYRYYFANAGYVEFGPKLSLVRSLEQTYAGRISDNEDGYNDNYYSASAGFGTFLTGTEAMTLKMGVRLDYAVTDLVSDAGETDGLPAFYTTYDAYTPTRPFRLSIGLELNFAMGQTGKMICGRRNFVFE